MFARQKTKGRREVLNLKSSINYGDAYATSASERQGSHDVVLSASLLRVPHCQGMPGLWAL